VQWQVDHQLSGKGNTRTKYQGSCKVQMVVWC